MEALAKEGAVDAKAGKPEAARPSVAGSFKEFMPESVPNSADEEPSEGFQRGNVSTGFAF